MKTTKKITKSNAGRPTKLDENIVVKLESILQIGETVETACNYARINKTTYYRWLEENPDFATKMEDAKKYSDIAAANVVVDGIIKDRDVQSAKWWLEKRRYKDSGTVVNIQQNYIQADPDEMKEFIKFRDSKRREVIEE